MCVCRNALSTANYHNYADTCAALFLSRATAIYASKVIHVRLLCNNTPRAAKLLYNDNGVKLQIVQRTVMVRDAVS